MSRKIYRLSIVWVVLSQIISSQSVFAQAQSMPENLWVCEQLKNTYQIVLTQRAMVNLPIDICDKIENAREDNKRAVIQYSPYLKIIVFSRKELSTMSTQNEISYEN